MKSNYSQMIEEMEDAELRREYSNLFDEGTNYRATPWSRDLVVSKLILITNEMRKRGI